MADESLADPFAPVALTPVHFRLGPRIFPDTPDSPEAQRTESGMALFAGVWLIGGAVCWHLAGDGGTFDRLASTIMLVMGALGVYGGWNRRHRRREQHPDADLRVDEDGLHVDDRRICTWAEVQAIDEATHDNFTRPSLSNPSTSSGLAIVIRPRKQSVRVSEQALSQDPESLAALLVTTADAYHYLHVGICAYHEDPDTPPTEHDERVVRELRQLRDQARAYWRAHTPAS